MQSNTHEAVHKLVRIEFDTGRGQPHGCVDLGDGTWRQFWGWLELMQAVEDFLSAAAAKQGEAR